MNHSPTTPQREAYGDWQTPMSLALAVCRLLHDRGYRPQVLVEPTCGKGNFIIAALEVWNSIEDVYAVELHRPYLDEIKQRVAAYKCVEVYEDTQSPKGTQSPKLAHQRGSTKNVKIHLYHKNIFDFDFSQFKDSIADREIMVLGNPPWVTNSRQGRIGGDNLPQKSNIKRVSGLDAITGKGNFDIAENICMRMTDLLEGETGCMAMLVKNSVVKNLTEGQRTGRRWINSIQQYNIDAQREFGAAVAASLLLMTAAEGATATRCQVRDFYTQECLQEYGWVGDHFVADTEAYANSCQIDGQSPWKWRSGMKHDCAKVMELTKQSDGTLVNGWGQTVDIEPDLVYPLVKSSDIKGGHITTTKRYVIVTQRSTANRTDHLKLLYPKTYAYLVSHADLLDNRGSTIYRNRPRFCIFGIGDYSFKKYKVAISGLYKHATFSLLGSEEGKPMMLDDTCYQLAFEDYEQAMMTWRILGSKEVANLVQSLQFTDAKRGITKDLLMRIDLPKAARLTRGSLLGLRDEQWQRYLTRLNRMQASVELSLFG